MFDFNTSSGDQDVHDLQMRFKLRKCVCVCVRALHLHVYCRITYIPPMYPPPRPVDNEAVCILPGCGRKYDCPPKRCRRRSRGVTAYHIGSCQDPVKICAFVYFVTQVRQKRINGAWR
jgi:hypothetical protein